MHCHSRNRILFVLKHRDAGSPGCWNYSDNGGHLSSGLYNSVRFVVDMLNDEGIPAKVVHVIDNNAIDREVHSFRPTHVIVEAYWVVPDKFDILKRLHPEIQWMVRNHSKSEFLAQEGIGFGWTLDYLKNGVSVACNSKDAFNDMTNLARAAKVPANVVYLPNFYPIESDGPIFDWRRDILNKFAHFKTMDIGCFGAIRPLKNHVNQALAAIDFAEDVGAKLRFHINSSRVEGNASPILNNLRGIFARLDSQHLLVEHKWLDHDDFLDLLPKMEIVSQVTFSETFNIVAADAVKRGVNVVGSSEIPWLPEDLQANPNSVESISRHYRKVWKALPSGVLQAKTRKDLCAYSKQSKYVWVKHFK